MRHISRNRVADMNVLLDCGDQCIKTSSWKESVQNFEANEMLRCWGIKRSLLGEEAYGEKYKPTPGKPFIQIERGRARYIKAPTIEDRVVQKALNQAVLLPEVLPRLIYDNGASVKGKGNDFGRKRFEAHIHKHFRERGDNGGYVLFGDFSKYFDNLRHDYIRSIVRPLIPSKEEYDLFCAILDSFRPDVSFMSDEEYEGAMETVYNALDHVGYAGDRSKLLGKGCDIGAELSQTMGVFYPHGMDNYFKNVVGVKYYGRYMDDTHCIGDSVEEMAEYKRLLKEQSDCMGIFLSEKKTHIMRLDRPFTWLKIQYTLTPSGHLVRNLSHDAIVRERKRIKYLAMQLKTGAISRAYAEKCYLCWRGSNKKYDAHRSIESLDALYRELIGPIIVYKK